MAETRIAGPLLGEHDITACLGSHLHCHWHERDEPGDPFRVCFECKHAYLSAADLLAEHNRQLAVYPGNVPETDVSRVRCCAFCMHDW